MLEDSFGEISQECNSPVINILILLVLTYFAHVFVIKTSQLCDGVKIPFCFHMEPILWKMVVQEFICQNKSEYDKNLIFNFYPFWLTFSEKGPNIPAVKYVVM